MIGRPLKAGKPRYADGSIRREAREPEERPEQIMATAINYRIKHCGATKDNATDQKWENPIGAMRLWALDTDDDSNGLSEVQEMALMQYKRQRFLAANRMRLPESAPRSASLDGSARGQDNREADEQAVWDARRAWDGARSAVLEYAGWGVSMVNLLDKAAKDEGDRKFWKLNLGSLRLAANILAVHYRIPNRY